MADGTELVQGLEQLQRRWEALTDVPEAPLSTMQVVEYSLGTQRKAEIYVNRLLGYLLEPDAPHGMGTDFLREFLDSLPDECSFDAPVHDLSGVEVSDQVHVGHGEDTESDRYGEADLVIQVPGEWFLLVEFKFAAGENSLAGEGLSQTEFYYDASHLDGEPKEAYVAGGAYLYIHPEDESSAREDGFANWTWSGLAERCLSDFLVDHGPRFPQRTVTQIRELRDDIREITGMSERQKNEDEKVDLYLEHYHAIRDVSEAFDERWERFTGEWPALLRQALEEDGYSTDDWNFLTRSKDWGFVFKHGWWRRTDDLEPISDRASGAGDVRIAWIHRLEQNREDAIGDRELEIQFRNCGSNDRDFRNAFCEKVEGERNALEALLPPSAELTGNVRKMITATYDIEVERHDDIFEAYIAALKRAVVELAWANDELTEQLSELYEAAANETYASTAH